MQYIIVFRGTKGFEKLKVSDCSSYDSLLFHLHLMIPCVVYVSDQLYIWMNTTDRTLPPEKIKKNQLIIIRIVKDIFHSHLMTLFLDEMKYYFIIFLLSLEDPMWTLFSLGRSRMSTLKGSVLWFWTKIWNDISLNYFCYVNMSFFGSEQNIKHYYADQWCF